jgi:hypothetical protein
MSRNWTPVFTSLGYRSVREKLQSMKLAATDVEGPGGKVPPEVLDLAEDMMDKFPGHFWVIEQEPQGGTRISVEFPSEFPF